MKRNYIYSFASQIAEVPFIHENVIHKLNVDQRYVWQGGPISPERLIALESDVAV